MRLMNWLAIGAVVLMAVLIAGCGGGEGETSEDQGSTSQGASSLFVVNTTSGSISGTKALKLRLQLQDHSDVWFTDRPERLAGPLDATDLMSSWKTFFRSDPPNAALVIDAGSGQESLPLTLESPVTSGEVVTFEATLLDAHPDDSAFAQHTVSSDVPENFGRASLFIDSTDPGSTPNAQKLQEYSTCLEQAATPADQAECQKILE
jgi:hypothetical protein